MQGNPRVPGITIVAQHLLGFIGAACLLGGCSRDPVEPTLDSTPPARIADLEVASSTPSTLDLTWTAPGDDGITGTAARYDVRYLNVPLTEETWSDAIPFVDVPEPRVAGTKELIQFTLAGSETADYSFGIKAIDEVGNESPLSNVLTATAGGPYIELYCGTGANGSSMDGSLLTDTSLSTPMDIAFGPDGTPYVLDWNNHRVLEVRDGRTYTIVGDGSLGSALDGSITGGINHPTHASFDDRGRMILSAWHNSKIMRCDLSSGVMVRACGLDSEDVWGIRCWNGDSNPAIHSCLDLPSCTGFDAAGNLYIADQRNLRIRKITPVNGEISSAASAGELSPIETVVGTGFGGNDGRGAYNGNNLPGTDTHLRAPGGHSAPPSSKILVRPDGEIYFTDSGNNMVRRLGTDGIVYAVAGGGHGVDTVTGIPLPGYTGDGGLATEATLHFPADLAMDSQSNLYIADTFNSVIRKVDANGIITTFAGRGPAEFADLGNEGPAVLAWIDRPFGVAVDDNDHLYIVDTFHDQIRIVRSGQ